MSQGTLTIYNASAGSGKTYSLTGAYLSELFRSRHNYRKILAVTFTNKATAEMKSRILENLYNLASGQSCGYLSDLMKDGNRDEAWIRKEAGEILKAVLHDFSRFNVSTIDSFFQKILRAFTREAGLHSGFSIELDHTLLLSEAVDDVIASAVKDRDLRNWLITYALSNIDDEKTWNLKAGIIKLGEELFSEKFRILSAPEKLNLENKEFLHGYILRLRMISSSFEKKMLDYGKDAEAICERFSLTEEMFFKKSLGVPKYIKQLASGCIAEPKEAVLCAIATPPRWSTGTPDRRLAEAVSSGLERIIRDAVSCYNNNIVFYRTSGFILSNIYALGILSDVSKKIHDLTTSQNRFLLSDAGVFLNQITAGDQCPFIYEKAGNRYENFMIDEFQDTSQIQWSNFKPLIDNSMAQGFDNLVVGDVKQSIYRWRNSDWRILGRVLASRVDKDRVFSENLSVNYRSRSGVIRFNNSLFSALPSIFDRIVGSESMPVNFRELYTGNIQGDPGGKDGGFVHIEFLENEKENKWQEKVLEKLPGIIEMVQDKGFRASDIGIIVRSGSEGARVLESITGYSATCSPEKRARYNYSIVSNDSLLLAKAPVICFIISVLSVVQDPSDRISRAGMLRFWLKVKGCENVGSVLFTPDEENAWYPEGYAGLTASLRHKPLFEAVENIIQFFSLGKDASDTAYLNTFQDHVLNITSNSNSGIRSFLEWWESEGQKKSVVLPGSQDAMRILTIHKSKGLEFGIVLLPFLAWELDHMPFKQPLLWVKPSVPPFDELGIVPVRYSGELAGTIFSENYNDEKFSVHLDNLNLLYVAFTRARDAIFAFSVSNPRNCGTIATVLRETLNTENITDEKAVSLKAYFDTVKNIFEYGLLNEHVKEVSASGNEIKPVYEVSRSMGSLRLKLHGENYFSSVEPEVRRKINYGKLMHGIFEGINITADVPAAVRALVLEGKIPENEAQGLQEKVLSLISAEKISEWFSSENQVMREAGILLPSGNIRRPDRVIFRNGKTTVIDFKFGEVNSAHDEQVRNYMNLMAEMGYGCVEGFIWYVEKNKIVTV